MVAGEKDPQVLAGLARESLRRKRKQLAEAVPGLIRDHHRFLLRAGLGQSVDASARMPEGFLPRCWCQCLPNLQSPPLRLLSTARFARSALAPSSPFGVSRIFGTSRNRSEFMRWRKGASPIVP